MRDDTNGFYLFFDNFVLKPQINFNPRSLLLNPMLANANAKTLLFANANARLAWVTFLFKVDVNAMIKTYPSGNPSGLPEKGTVPAP